VKIQFDANQQFQLDAVAAVVDLFEGQLKRAQEFTILNLGSEVGLFAGQSRTELGVGNALFIDNETLGRNTRSIQLRNDIEIPDPDAALDSWEVYDGPTDRLRECPHFSVEMETGTGKTYVYLRTIHELYQKYGFSKFVIVVPSVAIREGVLKSIEITREHFRALYNNPPFEYFVYDAKKTTRLRQFATGNVLSVMVINIDAFRKNFTGTEEQQKSNVIYKESDRLSGRQPIEFVQAARPIVIIDEPQSVDSTEKSQEAIKALNPLLTLRYSATHRDRYNLIYRLDPIRAFQLKLVKQIVVGSVTPEDAVNDGFVGVERIEYGKGIRAKLRIHVQTGEGPKERVVTAKQGSDLFVLSHEQINYREGFVVTEINAEPGNEFVRFSGGQTIRLGEVQGGMREEVWRVQIKETIKKHLEKEMQVQGRGIKVLSLFFIDRVANYRDYDEAGHPIYGKFARALEDELAELARDERYREIPWLHGPIDRLHNGYFSQDKKGLLKDTRGDTQADDEVYNLIMRDKERLLSIDEPLRFIFSHSALREGWDNPNVFQICTLNETRSAIKKRQEIGRGLRLPVDQDGCRVFDESVNRLFVMANESYEEFELALQKEYEEDCGVSFGKVPLSALARLPQFVDGHEEPIGRVAAERIWNLLVEQKIIDRDGRILPAFDPRREGFRIEIPETQPTLVPAIIDLLSSYQLERHIRRVRDQGPNRLKKEVILSPEFVALWERIKTKTTYRVEFETDTLVRHAVEALRRMERIEEPRIGVTSGRLSLEAGGIRATAMSAGVERVKHGTWLIPDILAYLQNETELTRSTLVRILKESGRLGEIFNNPQKYLDVVSSTLKREVRRLLVDGIKYERIEGNGAAAEWEMLLFKSEELIDYLSALRVKNSVYEYVVYESDIEREFAQQLDNRQDIKLFVKLPRWFEVDTPVGKYNPDCVVR
jgi:type III restriction enzyme